MIFSFLFVDQNFAKVRRKTVPRLPDSCLFTIPDPYKLTADGKRFLLLDESPVRRERLILYASDLQLDILFDSPIIYMDGTYSKTPAHFKQIYIIHGINYDICMTEQTPLFTGISIFVLGVPCVFALMVNKKGVNYRHIFSELKQLASERQKSFSPQIILTDFESGVLPVVKTEVNIPCFTE
jgi:hypothetical protein